MNFDYKKYFDKYSKNNNLNIFLSFEMPIGYETANGTFDFETKTVYINKSLLNSFPNYVQAFFFFHEMRHALQYSKPEKFSNEITLSLPYTIMYEGTCFKLVDGKYFECKLDGGEKKFMDIYLGQPYEVDANNYAYEETKKLYGDSNDLKSLYDKFMPIHPVSNEIYKSIYIQIDNLIKSN